MKKRILIIGLVLMLACMVVGCGKKDEMTFKDAAEHITYAGMKLAESGAADIGMTMGIKGDFGKAFPYMGNEQNMAFVEKFLEKAKLHYNVKYDFNDPNEFLKCSVAYGVLFDNKNLADLEFFSSNKKIGFKLPSMSEKGFTINYEKLMSFIENSDVKKAMTLDWKKYVKIITGDKSYYDFYIEEFPKYKELNDKFINEHFKKTDLTEIERDGKKIPVTEYKGTITFENSMNLLHEVMNYAKNDPELKKFLLDRGTKVFDEMIASKDYEKFGATEEEAKELKEEFLKFINEEWDKALEEALEEYKKALEEMNTEKEELKKFSIELAYRISDENVMDSSVMVMENNRMEIEAEYVINAYGKKVVMPSTENLYAIDEMLSEDITVLIENLKSNNEFFEYTKGFALDVINTVLEGENFSKVFTLMSENGLEEEVNMTKQSLNQAKMMLENMSAEDLFKMLGM